MCPPGVLFAMHKKGTAHRFLPPSLRPSTTGRAADAPPALGASAVHLLHVDGELHEAVRVASADGVGGDDVEGTHRRGAVVVGDHLVGWGQAHFND